jgi:hypothetical protein
VKAQAYAAASATLLMLPREAMTMAATPQMAAMSTTPMV